MRAAGSLACVPFVDGQAVERATPMPALIAKLERAFACASIAAPERTVAGIADNEELLLMPAWGDGLELGVKIVHIDSQRRPSIGSTYVVINRLDGRPRALIDGTVLTRRRTAATSVLAATKLAQRWKRLLLLGSGALIAPLIEAYSSAFDLSLIEVWARDRSKAQVVASKSLATPRVAVSVDLDASLMVCDIVSAATRSTKPIIHGERLSPGAHVDLIGAYRPDMSEADPRTFGRASIYVDTLAAAQREAGDLIQAVAAGALSWSDVRGDLHDLCSGAMVANECDGAITLFKSVGSAIEDLVAARMVIEAYRL